ncbi:MULTISPECIES: hypothetical protein [unclassified Streptomyces]|uniref:hypothetical protein n=1 Tax=unclassified Streptomyces TaxID=2593676 RepID=UPI0002F2636E|nr:MULTISPECIES: hypothetical protein [unclassified Streptomyces]MYR65423.1 hypothetical protein [Streptomyces sp. SID4939]MYT62552.1 hypothetical protein [Streptomyces sp. SID8357]MYT89360.1 hypothetical protein [Streptomyces sp. SID8360]MYW38218.1 hypothetical protein [Streptomyces sp. SID1]
MSLAPGTDSDGDEEAAAARTHAGRPSAGGRVLALRDAVTARSLGESGQVRGKPVPHPRGCSPER